MFEAFSHYLSYGATDQQTARMLSGSYDGLLVPGTVAAFQADGTRGFVLTLSATGSRTRYVVDPRFPLFQQRLAKPKKSHESLAAILGDPNLISRSTAPEAEDFDATRCEGIAQHWLDFNRGYTTVSSKHFNKYAERLGESIVPDDTQGPERILAPYTMATSTRDAWWSAAQRLWQAHVSLASGTDQLDLLLRVVAAQHAPALSDLLADTPEAEVAVWVDGLDELDASDGGLRELAAYRDAITAASERGQSLFALYGGFFSVLMSSFGLRGASHGIGYGEARTWRELPQSGPPPARYYLPKAHRYISQDLALYLWREARELVECRCGECNGGTPAALDYHGLMRHSVRCRQAEIDVWSLLPASTAAQHLVAAAAEFETELEWLDLPRNLKRQADACHAHLRGWAAVLDGSHA